MPNKWLLNLLFTLCFLYHYIYHSFRTFQFTNISPFEECAFVLKSQVALNEIEPNSTNIMCLSIIDKYINNPNQYELLSLAKFSVFYNIKKKISKCDKPNIIRFVNYNKYKILKIGQENKFYCIHHFKIQKIHNLELWEHNMMKILRLDLFSTPKCHIQI